MILDAANFTGANTRASQRLEDVLHVLLLPAGAQLGLDAYYVDETLSTGLMPQLRAWWRHRRRKRAWTSVGLSKRMVYRLREAGGEVFEAVPLSGAHRARRSTKDTLALLLIGGRMAICAHGAAPNLAQAMMDETGAQWDETDGATIFLGSGRVFRLAGRHEMLRVPVGDAAVERLARGFAALTHAATLSLPFAVPSALRQFALGEFEVFVESRAPFAGFDYLNMSAVARDAVATQAMAAATRMHESSRRVRVCMEGDLEDLFAAPVRRLQSVPAMREVGPRFNDFLSRVRTEFLGEDLVTVLSHGDCKIANFLHDGQLNVRGLVDWDRAHIDGLPGVDLVHYRAFDAMLAGRGTIAETLLGNAIAMEHGESLAAYRAQFRIEGFRWRAVASMALLLHVAEQLGAGNQLAVAEAHAFPGVVGRALDWALATSPTG